MIGSQLSVNALTYPTSLVSTVNKKSLLPIILLAHVFVKGHVCARVGCSSQTFMHFVQ